MNVFLTWSLPSTADLSRTFEADHLVTDIPPVSVQAVLRLSRGGGTGGGERHGEEGVNCQEENQEH